MSLITIEVKGAHINHQFVTIFGRGEQAPESPFLDLGAFNNYELRNEEIV